MISRNRMLVAFKLKPSSSRIAAKKAFFFFIIWVFMIWARTKLQYWILSKAMLVPGSKR